MLALSIAVAVVATALSQSSAGSIRGQVRDGSDAVVPGVTIEMVVLGGSIAVSVTDAVGNFAFDAVPAGLVTLRMALDGFQPSTQNVEVQSGAETVVSTVLLVAPLSERVLVTAPAPPLPPPPPEPEYRLRPVPLPDLESVCGPAKADRAAALHGTLVAHRRDAKRILFRLDDEITLRTQPGASLTVGQNLVVRRYFQSRDGKVTGEQTVGVVQIVIATAAEVVAVAIHACGALRVGDLLMPFRPEPTRDPEPAGVPAWDEAARVLFGSDNQLLGAPGRLMVIDRGWLHGIRLGQRLTLFRRGTGGRTVVGEAVVTALREDSAQVRIERASTAVWLGDSAAPHRRGP